jgi:hypothetical protein
MVSGQIIHELCIVLSAIGGPRMKLHILNVDCKPIQRAICTITHIVNVNIIPIKTRIAIQRSVIASDVDLVMIVFAFVFFFEPIQKKTITKFDVIPIVSERIMNVFGFRIYDPSFRFL